MLQHLSVNNTIWMWGFVNQSHQSPFFRKTNTQNNAATTMFHNSAGVLLIKSLTLFTIHIGNSGTWSPVPFLFFLGRFFWIKLCLFLEVHLLIFAFSHDDAVAVWSPNLVTTTLTTNSCLVCLHLSVNINNVVIWGLLAEMKLAQGLSYLPQVSKHHAKAEEQNDILRIVTSHLIIQLSCRWFVVYH